ncbi:MAG: hypothetical protein JWM89_2976 [Acidimicrobiales bacterium]|nr:hypothetical protein [Acidimicrobiales bacterium]
MSIADPPLPPAAASGQPPRPGPRRGVLRWTALVATIGVVVALAGVGVLALPVHSPLQDCGSTFSFLYDGRTDVMGDPANPPKGHTRAEVEATNRTPCRPRVADRAEVAGGLLLGGLLVAVVASGIEMTVRLGSQRGRRRRRRITNAPGA